MNQKIFTKKRIFIQILILLVSGLFYPLQVRSQSSVPSQLKFFVYPPNWSYPYDDIVGNCWMVSINDGEGSSLTGHLDVPSRYYGKDPSGDWLSLPVKVIWDLSSDISSVHIPSSILIIGDNAFRGCSKLESIVIPNTVKYIGYCAFSDCPLLSSVVVSPENEEFVAFSGCDIKKGAYPEGKRAFVAAIEVPYPNNCIPDSAGLIYNSGSTAFYFAPWNIAELELPETVTAIGPKALAGCTKLKTLRVRSATPPSVSDDTFNGAIIGSIEVPKGCKDRYVNDKNWSRFASIIKEVNTAIVLNKTDVSLKVSESVELTATVENQSVIKSKTEWSSSNDAVATVDSNGLIKALSVGKTVVTATYENLTAQCDVTVGKTPVAELVLSSIKEQMKVGQNVRLQVTVNPETATDKTVYWSSSDVNVVTVDETGLIYAKSIGNAIITASSGNVTAICEIEVIETLPERVSIYWKCDNLAVNATFQLRASIYPETTTDKTITWHSSDDAIASVDNAGLVTAHAVGVVTITATCGSKSASHDINIILPSPTPTSITLNESSVVLKGIEQVQLTAVILPVEASVNSITWTSSDENVAIVDETGLVTSVKPGRAVITASCGTLKAACDVLAIEVKVSKISLSHENVTLKVGESMRLNAEVYPDNANNKRVLWSSSNENIVTVDSEGNLTATGIGEAYIVAACDDAVKFCDVRVNTSDVQIALNETEIILKTAESFQLTATVNSEISESESLKWISDDETVAIVDENGLVTAVSTGTTVITVAYGEASATCKVTVKPATITIIPFVYDGINYNIYEEEGTASVADNRNLIRKDLVIPDSIIYQSNKYAVTEIEAMAFWKRDDMGRPYNNTGLTGSLTIGNAVKIIGRYAFCYCNSFTGSLTIPNSVTTIENNAFNNCYGFTGSLIIPNSVTELGSGAFLGCKGFDGTLTLSNSMEIIGSGAFEGCNSLTGDLNIPNSVVAIGSSAFSECYGFTGMLTIPNSVTGIGSGAFDGCKGLTGDLNIPNSVTFLGSYAFSGCSGFTGSLTIPDSVTEIYTNAFYGCSGFTGSLTIHDTVTYIYEGAFYGCSGFDTLYFQPQNIEYIMRNGFGATEFSEIYCDAVIPTEIASDAFSDWDYKNSVLNVPVKSLSKYGNCYGWRSFQNMKAIGELASGIILDKTETSIFVDEMVRINAIVEPDNAIDKSISWESDDEAVATVSEEGIVTAVSVGTAIITATCGDVSATCKITVKPVPASEVILDVENMLLQPGERKALTATITPENTTDKTILWRSDNESVATVSEYGIVTGISFGETNITATCGDVSAICKVTVTGTAGIAALFDDVNSAVEVYTVHGLKLNINKASELKNLTRGFYVINGKKVFVE